MIEKLILNASALAILLPLILAVMRYKRVREEMPFFLAYILTTGLASLSAQILWWMHINNLFIFHFHTVVEFLLISSFYLHQMETPVAQRKVFFLQDAFVIIAILSAIYIQPPTKFNSVARAIEALAIIYMAIALFQKMLRELKINSLWRSSKFWVNTAYFFYYSGSFFLFLLGTIIIDRVPIDTSRVIWSFFGVLTMIMYLLISIGLWNIKTI